MNAHPTRKRLLIRICAVVLVAVGVAGCGEIKNTFTPAPGSANQLTVALAGRPNALYAGLYEALALGYFKQTDIDVHIVVPAPSQDPLTLLHNGRVLLAFSSEVNVFLHRNRNQPVAGIAAIVHVPLSQIRVRTPAAASSGGVAPSAASTRTVTATTGSTATATTRRGGAGAKATVTTLSEPDARFWPLKLRRLLAVPGYPTYDGLVLVARGETISGYPGLVSRFAQALARGYRAVQADPAQAIVALIDADPSLAVRKQYERAMLRAALPQMFPRGLPLWGYQREAEWNTFGDWLNRNGFLTDPNALLELGQASTNQDLAGLGI
jgi:putative hydroxymethylpyrimidine transport system substrate-binding protein